MNPGAERQASVASLRDGDGEYTGGMLRTALLLALLQAADLPGQGPVTRVLVDSKGRTWVNEEPFVTLADNATDEMEKIPKLDLGKSYADKARALRFGKLVLVDSAGRIWLSVNGTKLWCYDGKEFTKHDATAGATFTGAAIERGGALWFLDECALHRFDGKWTAFPVAGKPAALNLLVDTEGHPWIWSKDAVRRLDGDKLVEIKNRPAHAVGGLVPLGKKMLIVHDGGIFTWPDDESTEPPVPDLKTLPDCIEQIGAVDAATRMKASYAIVQMGKEALPVLKEAIEKTTQEVLKKRLERLAAEIETPRAPRVHLGTFYLERMQFLWKTRHAAYVVGFVEGELGRERALLRVNAEGVTRMADCEEALDYHLSTQLPNVSSYEEPDGTLWISRHKTGLWRFDGKSLQRVAGASEDGSYSYLGLDATGAQWWRQVYTTKRMLKVFEGTAEAVKGR